MCGISGIYNYSDKNISSKPVIEKILKLQSKRGPDDSGTWVSKCNKIFFGHNRLSIIDLSKNAKQPFLSNDKNYVIIFNGEMYNFKKIKKELIEKKINFKSNSDTEVIIEAYKYWGLNFLKKLRGMFAFALWDLVKKKLILARDPFGIKPLYYSNKNGVFYFASQAKSLLTIDDISSNKSEAGILSYYLWGNISEPLTLYKDIKSIEKGTYKIINEDGIEENYQYANLKESILNAEPINFIKKTDAIGYLKDIIEETVKYHQVSDIPVTFLLSAGIDSSVILASIKEEDKKNCSALTLDFNYNGKSNETTLSKKTAAKNNIDHKIERIDVEEINNLSEQFYMNMDLPTNDGFNNFLVSYFAKKNKSKVIISGIGGDELFFGYSSFSRIPKINNLLKFVPKNNLINNFFKSNVQNILKKHHLNTKYSGIFEYGRNLDTAFLLQRSLFLPNEIKEMLSPEIFKLGFDQLNVFENINSDVKGFEQKKLSIMYLEIKYYLCSKILRDSDWTSMSHSIEMRMPFVDWFFFQKLLPLLKSNINIGKKNLLDCVKNKIPNELYNRKKTGFGIPHKSYFEKLSNSKTEYSHPIKDWSIFSYKKFLGNEKK